MFRISVRLAPALVLVVAGPAAAQPRLPVQLRSFGLPNQAPIVGAPLQSQVAVWAGQLALQVQALRGDLTALRLPLQQRMVVGLAADRAVRAAEDFQRLARQTVDPARLSRGHEALDAAVGALVTAAGQAAPGNPTVAQSVARVQYADERLHAALEGPGPGPDQQRDAVARLARALADQAGELRELVLEVMGNVVNREVMRALRSVGSRSARVAAVAESGRTIDAAQREYAALGADWQAVTTALAPATDPRVRVQAARVDGLFRELGRLLGGPQVPAPGPAPLPPPGPGFVPRQGRVFVTGAGEGGGPHVRVFHDFNGGQSFDFFAYDPNYRGGVRVAVADLNGDGFPDIVTAPGRDHPPLVRVFDGRDLSLMAEFMAYDPAMTLGVFVAAADLTADGRALVATGPGVGGGAHVRVFDLAQGKEIDGFFAHPPELTCGARVALGDVNGDGVPDLVTAPGAGTGPLVQVFDGRNRRKLSEWAAYDPNYLGGVFVATGDVRGNGRAEVLTGTDDGGTGTVRVFDALRKQMIGELSPFPRGFRGGVRVGAFDVTRNGQLDVVCAPGPGQVAAVRAFDGRSRRLLGEFAPYGPTFTGGVFVASR
jgi:hypothetical protein